MVSSNLATDLKHHVDASSHVYKRVCPSVRLSVPPSVCPSLRPSVCPFVPLSVPPTVGPSVGPFLTFFFQNLEMKDYGYGYHQGGPGKFHF